MPTIRENIVALDTLRDKLLTHRRKVVGLINDAANMDGDAMAKVALIVAIQEGLAAVNAAQAEEQKLG